jgi:carbohydrate-binding DOMON domain-containing protein
MTNSIVDTCMKLADMLHRFYAFVVNHIRYQFSCVEIIHASCFWILSTQTHTHTHTHTHTNIHTRTHTNTRTHVRGHTHARTRAHTHTHTVIYTVGDINARPLDREECFQVRSCISATILDLTATR